jgi:hypothetical protein
VHGVHGMLREATTHPGNEVGREVEAGGHVDISEWAATTQLANVFPVVNVDLVEVDRDIVDLELATVWTSARVVRGHAAVQ